MKKGMLLEIGTEEIPSRFIPQTLEVLREMLHKEMEARRVECGEMLVMGTPRRLTIFAELEDQQHPLESERIGPPKSVAFDPQGKPTKAALGFAQKEGVQVEDLEVRATEKGEYLCVRKHEAGRQTREILSVVLPRLITAIPFTKSMRWSDLELRFARPIHWILALFDMEVIPFTLEHLKSDHLTRGHRFLHPEPFTVTGMADYLEGLRQACVIVDPEERRELILREVQEAAQKAGGTPLENKELLEEITYLVEYPVAMSGGFDKGYLELPREVLITAMQHHQRYIPVVDKKGRLLPSFVAVSNTRPRTMEVVRKGNERVLRARLADAQFFFQEDQKRPLEERVEKLKGVIFQAKLGTSYEKVMRIQGLAVKLAQELAPEVKEVVARGALLCKADLVTDMVGEFPQLQGVMGREYALLGGEDPAVAQVIFEHYLPRFAGDELPSTPAGDIVSIADKMDTVIGCFGAGLLPTGTSDPFALRRQTLGVINIILGKGYCFSLRRIIEMGVDLLREKIERPPEEVQADCLAFFRGRFVGLLVAQGYPVDLVEAVLAVQCDDLVDARARVEAVARFRGRPEFEPVAVAFKRVANILKGVDHKGRIDTACFEAPEEQALHGQYQEIEGKFSASIKRGDYEGALAELAKLRPPVDALFEHCMVMAEDKKVRANRLALLGEIAGLFSQIIDFSRLGTGEEG
ncbi:MAG: glycine--tRNA ligase subunit beta [Deltaproteobacteria bacterium RBG_13_52_11]|nr:MAG: glycine--tRNA ligase subunit beta [Deltaproteobacteria bacterium RBG_13_52_11]